MSKATLLPLATNDVVNVAAVTHRSPFRYPGGKTWLVPTIRLWLRTRKNRPRVLAEPFAGGAIVSLFALFENLVNQIVLIEKDEDVGAVWKEWLTTTHLWQQVANSDLRVVAQKYRFDASWRAA